MPGIAVQPSMNQAFEDWWNENTAPALNGSKKFSEHVWNAAIEHIRTTEPMPINERALASLIRIEDIAFRILNKVSPIPHGRIERASSQGWCDIKEINGVWVGDEPGSVRHKEIPQ